MLAVCLTGTIDRPNVEVDTIDRPEDAAERVIVEVAAAGITRMEPRWKTNWQNADGSPRRRPVVLGLEFAGRVRSLGPNVQGFAVGQDVFGMLEPSRGGGMAEFASVPADQVLPMPPALSYEDASVLPLAGMTAWQGIVRHGELKRGQSVLIHGGAGGVGAFATQIARWIDAHVVVTAAAADAALCSRLGANEVIDYDRERFGDRGELYDLVFDTIGGNVQERSWAVVKRGGRLITIAGEAADAPSQERARSLGITARFFVVENDLDDLRQLTTLVADATIRSIIGKRVKLTSAAEAYDGHSAHHAGKAVLLCSERG